MPGLSKRAQRRNCSGGSSATPTERYVWIDNLLAPAGPNFHAAVSLCTNRCESLCCSESPDLLLGPDKCAFGQFPLLEGKRKAKCIGWKPPMMLTDALQITQMGKEETTVTPKKMANTFQWALLAMLWKNKWKASFTLLECCNFNYAGTHMKAEINWFITNQKVPC